MKNIVLMCSQGASTSMLAQAMQKEADKRGLDCKVDAMSVSRVGEVRDRADAILLGPQVGYMQQQVAKEVPCPVATIGMSDYGMMNGAAVLDVALKAMGE
jgi:PTS system cellobiose-specific IIB component